MEEVSRMSKGKILVVDDEIYIVHILDFSLGMEGYEVCKNIKSSAATQHIPVILLSAKGRNVDQKLGFDVGADDYITKPFSPRKLVERINQLLGQTVTERPAPSA